MEIWKTKLKILDDLLQMPWRRRVEENRLALPHQSHNLDQHLQKPDFYLQWVEV